MLSILVTVALAVLMHLDWLLAVPAFALVAWYVHRAAPGHALRAGLVLIAVAAFLAQVAEPLWELSTGATLDWTFGPERIGAFARYGVVGLLTFAATIWALRRTTSSHPH